MASNRGNTTIRGTNYKSPHGLPLDFLDRVLIMPTFPYGPEEIRDILSIRAQEEEVTLSADALALLTKIGQETSLRYASHLITTASLIAAKRKGSAVEVADVQRSYQLFFDESRSVKFLQEYENRFIGEEGKVNFTTLPAVAVSGEAMDIST
jgi:RuvB-like protein 2